LTEAKRILDVRRGAAQRGESVLPHVDRVRWEEAQADLIAYYEATGKRDVAEAKSRVAHLGLYFAGWRIARIDTPAIHGSVVHRKQQGAAPATINRELATLSKALRVAHQNKKLAGQLPRIEKLQEDNIRQGFFEREQFEAVRKCLPAYAQPVVTFMYLTGWRIRSEVLPLQWRQVGVPKRLAIGVELDHRSLRFDGNESLSNEDAADPFPFTHFSTAKARYRGCPQRLLSPTSLHRSFSTVIGRSRTRLPVA
jgi:hypothetical protein